MTKTTNEQGFISAVYEGKSHEDLHTCLEEPKKKKFSTARRKVSTASTNLILLEDLILPEKINTAKESQRLSEDKDYLEMKIRR
ncbi:hypothetical protein Tco_0189422, partial [Tanacetum coccineum]